MRKHFFLLAFLLFIGLINHSQTLTQTLKGFVSDRETGNPLAGANFLILNIDAPSGISTDGEGKFSFENGRVVSNDIFSLGMVPVFNFRVEFQQVLFSGLKPLLIYPGGGEKNPAVFVVHLCPPAGGQRWVYALLTELGSKIPYHFPSQRILFNSQRLKSF